MESDDEGSSEDEEEKMKSRIAEESPRGRFKRFFEELGRGAYKIVFKGIDHETGREIAWNAISLSTLPLRDKARI